jgi:hypothetical protein
MCSFLHATIRRNEQQDKRRVPVVSNATAEGYMAGRVNGVTVAFLVISSRPSGDIHVDGEQVA